MRLIFVSPAAADIPEGVERFPRAIEA